MKKVLWIVALMAGMASVQAQQVGLTRGVETKSLDAEEISESVYVGSVESYDCWIMDAKRDKKQVVITDGNLEIVQKILLNKSDDAELLTMALAGRNLFLVTVDGSSKGRTVLFAYRLELLKDMYGKMTVEKRNPDTLQVFKYDRKDNCKVWGATSPDGHYLTTLVTVENVKQKQFSTQVSLYDALSRQIWSKEVPLFAVQDLYLTDAGRLVTLGTAVEGEETHLIYGVVDDGRQDVYKVTVKCDPLRELRLVNVLDNHVLAVGTYSPMGRSIEKGYTGGTVSMSFNTDSASLSGFALRPFQNEDMCILYNKNTKKVQRDHEADNVKVLAMTPTPYGAAMVVGRSLVVEAFDDANNPITKQVVMGLHVEGVDIDGRQIWVRNIRCNDWTKEAGKPCYLGLLSTPRGVCLMKSEHPKYPADYNITDEVKPLEMGTKANLVVYTIAPDGEVSKQIVEGKAKQILLRSMIHPDGSLAMLLGKGGKIRLDILKF